MSQSRDYLQVSVSRGTEDQSSFSTYEVPEQESQTVLDVVTWIQRHREPSLSYRFACRVGMCGSCAMMVNGEPRWTCRTHVKKVLRNGKLRIEPLRNLPVIRDLVCDMTEFFDKWTRAKGVFEPTKTREDAFAATKPSDPKRTNADVAIECINCAVCYAACDTVNLNRAYLGPAALNRAWTLANDDRDGAYFDRLAAVSESDGCMNCHSHQSCMTYCPNELNPTASIAGLKRLASLAYLKGNL
ncbi:MAG: succinate dehydrogenase/fumarate reductase iron-sulfur subunit [Methyloligellaceae bacterium]